VLLTARFKADEASISSPRPGVLPPVPIASLLVVA